MNIKMTIPLLAIVILGCREGSSKLNKPKLSSDSSIDDYGRILDSSEKSYTRKNNDSLGTLIKTISFNVKTDDTKDFEDGVIHWANIENPEKDIPYLIDKDKVVITESRIKIVIDYPLTNEYKFVLESKNGFTRQQLLKEISKSYYKIFEEEENTATIKTIPAAKRTKTYNRNQTNGKYGIWGHDIADLVLANILVYKTDDGEIILALEMES